MGETLSVTLDSSNDNPQPTLEELAAKMDAEASPSEETVTQEERPAGLPEKFKSVDDLIKAYGELERKLGAGDDKPEAGTDADTEEGDQVEEEASEEETTEEDAAREAVEDAGLDFNAMSERFWEKGELPQEDYEALEKAGIPKALVDQFIAGQQAVQASLERSVHETVGGKEAYESMLGWAAENYSADEIEAYNEAMASGNVNAIRMAVKGLQGRFEAENGFEPRVVVTGNAKATADVYESLAQMQADMRDPRYKTDPAFRKKVETKLARSSII